MELTAAERKKLKEEIKKDLMKEIEGMVHKEILKQIKGDKKTQKEIKELTAKVLVELFRVLWNRNSMWKNNVTK